MRFEINFVGTKDILYTQSEQLRGVAEEYLTRLAKNGMAAVVYIYSKPAPQAPNFWYGRQPLPRLDYVRGESLPFVDSWKDLGILVDTELKFHWHNRSIVGKSSGTSVNLLNSTICRSREFT